MSRFLPLFALAILLAAASGPIPAMASEASPAPELSAQAPPVLLAQASSPAYADVAPIFAKHCVMCHSGAKPAANLRLDNHTNILNGTRKERVVIPGSPQKSELLQRIKGTKTPRMPKNGPPWLTAEETSLIEKWIGAGASAGPKVQM